MKNIQVLVEEKVQRKEIRKILFFLVNRTCYTCYKVYVILSPHQHFTLLKSLLK